MKLNNLIAEKLKSKRNELGLSYSQLALILGCTYKQIQHYEKATCQIPIKHLKDFALLCKLPIDWLLLHENEVLIYLTAI